jgi:hypothetical protein
MDIKHTCVLAITLLVFGGCSRIPGEAAAKKAFVADVEAQSSKLVQVASFRKTDGKELNAFGPKGYAVEFEAVLKVVANAVKKPASFGPRKPYALRAATPPAELERQNAELTKALAAAPEVAWAVAHKVEEDVISAGTELRLEGQVIFEQKESGWNVATIHARVSK